jgi:predicted  nucleic acid-binding Zn-ribbon protein
VSAVAAPARHRFAVTKRQLRSRIDHLKGQLARAQKQAAQQVREDHAVADDLRARLTAAGEQIADRDQTIAQLRADAVDLSVLRKQLADTQAMNRRLGADLTATRAALENATRVTVPPMYRDTSGDQPTVPVRIVTLQEAHGGAR